MAYSARSMAAANDTTGCNDDLTRLWNKTEPKRIAEIYTLLSMKGSGVLPVISLKTESGRKSMTTFVLCDYEGSPPFVDKSHGFDSAAS